MDLSHIDLLVVAASMLAVWMCGTTRIEGMLLCLAAQTALLAFATILHGADEHAWHYMLLAGVVLAVKAVAIPLFLSWSARRMSLRRDACIFLKPPLALLLGFCALMIGFYISPQIANSEIRNAGTAGMSIALLFLGMLVMVTRRLAISQIIGFLVFENGIFLYGLSQTHGLPMMVEMGIMFDVLVGVIIAGVVIYRINRNFEHIDVTQMRELRH